MRYAYNEMQAPSIVVKWRWIIKAKFYWFKNFRSNIFTVITLIFPFLPSPTECRPGRSAPLYAAVCRIWQSSHNKQVYGVHHTYLKYPL